MRKEAIEELPGLLGEFLKWWRREKGSSREFFHEDLVFDGVFDDTEGQLWLIEQALPFTSLRILESFSSEENAALVVEGVDPITDLSMRIAWLFKIRDGKIERVIQTYMSIPPNKGTDQTL